MCPDDDRAPDDPALDHDELLDDISFTTRRDTIQDWIDFFTQAFHDDIAQHAGLDPHLTWRDDAVVRLSATYWDVVRSEIRPKLLRKEGGRQGRIDHHKICSVMEIIIMCVLPIEHPDRKQRKFLNALFAWFAAIAILEAWKPQLRDFPIPPEFEREHMYWLVNLATTRECCPYFANSAAWYFFELFVFERLERLSTNDEGAV